MTNSYAVWSTQTWFVIWLKKLIAATIFCYLCEDQTTPKNTNLERSTESVFKVNEITFEPVNEITLVSLPSGTWSDIFRLLAHAQLCHNFMSKDFSDAPFCQSREPFHECRHKNNLREERNTKSPSCLDLELTTEFCLSPIAVVIQIFKKGAGNRLGK